MPNIKEAYLCLSAMLRAREPKLLNNDRAERMLDAASFEEAAKLLTDCGYGDMSELSAKEIEAALAQRRAALFDEMKNLAPDGEIVDMFQMKYDYHNAKTIIKAEAMGTDAERLLSQSGRIGAAELLALYNDDRCGELPRHLGKAMEEAKAVLARSSNPQMADFVLDRAYFAELSSVAKELENTFITGYIQILIDSAYLKSAVRTLRMGKGAEFMADALITGGSVDPQRIMAAGDKESIAALFAHTALEKAAALGAEAAEGGSLTDFERSCDDAVNAYLKNAKLVSYGPEALVAYLAAAEAEITAVRMILTGRLSGIAARVIKERLRDMYA